MIWCILVSIIIYIVLPNLYYRYFSKKVMRKVPCKNKTIFLTFDDGPDPRYTPKLLNVLKKNGIKCTFFVLAEMAQKYPEIIKYIASEGHYIGLHSLKHLNPILLPPCKIKRDFSKSVNIMSKLGINIKFFRPPWGMFNPFTFYYARSNHFKIVLWSLHAMDWSRWVSIGYIKNKLINKIKPGDIILLHDGRGAKNAPNKTISALEIIIPILKKSGYNFVLLKDISEEDL